MEKNPVAWGLDIGHSSIKAVKLSRASSGDVTVQGYAFEPIATGEGTDRDQAVLKALEGLTHREEFGQTPVVAALSGRQIFSRTINIPVINAKKVAKMVELEARQQIPGNFDDVEWGYHLSPAADGASNDVALFAARKDLIADLVSKCKKTGINLVGVSVSSLALYNFIRYDQEFANEETVAILDVGAENTDLVLYQGEMLWMRTLAASGNDITKAFMKKFRVSFEEAEQLKRQLGESRQADKVFKVIEGSLNELLSEVTRSFGFYKQTNNTAKIENLVISGNTFKLPNLPQYFADRLRLAIITLEDLEKIKVEKGIDRTHFLHDLQSLGVAMGLAVQGCGAAKANVNLMPTGDRLQQLLRTKRWAAAAVLIMLFSALILSNFITGTVIEQNVELVNRIKDAGKENVKEEAKARETLDLVFPRAKALAVFDLYGRHKGLNVAIHQGVAQVVADAVTSYGKVSWTPPADVLEGDDQLQRLYMSKVEIPSFQYRVDPFHSMSEERRIVIEILIVREDKDDSPAISAELLRRLQAIAVPSTIVAFHHGKTLFRDVQNRGIRNADLSYWYVDAKRLDEAGNLKPVEKEVRIKASLATFDCTIAADGGEVQP